MNYPKRELIPVGDSYDDNGNPTTWAIPYDVSGKTCYLWIDLVEDGYILINSDCYNVLGDKVYKTLNGAKRKAEEIVWRREEIGQED